MGFSLAPYIQGMNKIKTSLVLVGVAIAGNILVFFVPLSAFWKGIVNICVLVVIVTVTSLTALDISKTRREDSREL